jgi:signal transduction histidine kinase
MGAGLYLVKRYIELMNGSLAFESTLGEGTRVRVTLPGAAVVVAPRLCPDADAA